MSVSDLHGVPIGIRYVDRRRVELERQEQITLWVPTFQGWLIMLCILIPGIALFGKLAVNETYKDSVPLSLGIYTILYIIFLPVPTVITRLCIYANISLRDVRNYRPLWWYNKDDVAYLHEIETINREEMQRYSGEGVMQAGSNSDGDANNKRIAAMRAAGLESSAEIVKARIYKRLLDLNDDIIHNRLKTSFWWVKSYVRKSVGDRDMLPAMLTIEGKSTLATSHEIQDQVVQTASNILNDWDLELDPEKTRLDAEWDVFPLWLDVVILLTSTLFYVIFACWLDTEPFLIFVLFQVIIPYYVHKHCSSLPRHVLKSSVRLLIGVAIGGIALLYGGEEVFLNYGKIKYNFLVNSIGLPETLADFVILGTISWVLFPFVIKAIMMVCFGHLGRVQQPRYQERGVGFGNGEIAYFDETGIKKKKTKTVKEVVVVPAASTSDGGQDETQDPSASMDSTDGLTESTGKKKKKKKKDGISMKSDKEFGKERLKAGGYGNMFDSHSANQGRPFDIESPYYGKIGGFDSGHGRGYRSRDRYLSEINYIGLALVIGLGFRVFLSRFLLCKSNNVVLCILVVLKDISYMYFHFILSFDPGYQMLKARAFSKSFAAQNDEDFLIGGSGILHQGSITSDAFFSSIKLSPGVRAFVVSVRVIDEVWFHPRDMIYTASDIVRYTPADIFRYRVEETEASGIGLVIDPTMRAERVLDEMYGKSPFFYPTDDEFMTKELRHTFVLRYGIEALLVTNLPELDSKGDLMAKRRKKKKKQANPPVLEKHEDKKLFGTNVPIQKTASKDRQKAQNVEGKKGIVEGKHEAGELDRDDDHGSETDGSKIDIDESNDIEPDQPRKHVLKNPAVEHHGARNDALSNEGLHAAPSSGSHRARSRFNRRSTQITRPELHSESSLSAGGDSHEAGKGGEGTNDISATTVNDGAIAELVGLEDLEVQLEGTDRRSSWILDYAAEIVQARNPTVGIADELSSEASSHSSRATDSQNSRRNPSITSSIPGSKQPGLAGSKQPILVGSRSSSKKLEAEEAQNFARSKVTDPESNIFTSSFDIDINLNASAGKETPNDLGTNQLASTEKMGKGTPWDYPKSLAVDSSPRPNLAVTSPGVNASPRPFPALNLSGKSRAVSAANLNMTSPRDGALDLSVSKPSPGRVQPFPRPASPRSDVPTASANSQAVDGVDGADSAGNAVNLAVSLVAPHLSESTLRGIDHLTRVHDSIGQDSMGDDLGSSTGVDKGINDIGKTSTDSGNISSQYEGRSDREKERDSEQKEKASELKDSEQKEANSDSKANSDSSFEAYHTAPPSGGPQLPGTVPRKPVGKDETIRQVDSTDEGFKFDKHNSAMAIGMRRSDETVGQSGNTKIKTILSDDDGAGQAQKNEQELQDAFGEALGELDADGVKAFLAQAKKKENEASSSEEEKLEEEKREEEGRRKREEEEEEIALGRTAGKRRGTAAVFDALNMDERMLINTMYNAAKLGPDSLPPGNLPKTEDPSVLTLTTLFRSIILKTILEYIYGVIYFFCGRLCCRGISSLASAPLRVDKIEGLGNGEGPDGAMVIEGSIDFTMLNAISQAKIHRMFLARGYFKLMCSICLIGQIYVFPMANHGYWDCEKLYDDYGRWRWECDKFSGDAIIDYSYAVYINKPEPGSNVKLICFIFLGQDILELLTVNIHHRRSPHWWFINHFVNAPFHLAKVPETMGKWGSYYFRLMPYWITLMLALFLVEIFYYYDLGDVKK